MMKELFGEFLGTLILILLGNGVVAGVVLPKTKSNNAGWIVITMGWGIAVAVAAFVSGTLSPAHLNPAVTFAMALKGTLSWASVFPYTVSNLISEILGTFVLVLTIFALGLYDLQAGIGTFAVGTLIVGIVLSLGGTTGCALNPARDLGPRIMHSILPISNKGDGDWSYAWIPVVGPVIGAALAVLVFSLF